MKLTIYILGLVSLAVARPPDVPPDDLPVPIPLPTTGDAAPMPPPSSASIPVPSTTDVGTDPAPPPPSGTAVPPGPICECGYTYCADVLMGMAKPWTEQQLDQAYCDTPQATCNNGVPSTNVTSALYLCLCGSIDQKVGDHLELVCGCDKCLNVGPDFRGRCQTPCLGADQKCGDGQVSTSSRENVIGRILWWM